MMTSAMDLDLKREPISVDAATNSLSWMFQSSCCHDEAHRSYAKVEVSTGVMFQVLGNTAQSARAYAGNTASCVYTVYSFMQGLI